MEPDLGSTTQQRPQSDFSAVTASQQCGPRAGAPARGVPQMENGSASPRSCPAQVPTAPALLWRGRFSQLHVSTASPGYSDGLQ